MEQRNKLNGQRTLRRTYLAIWNRQKHRQNEIYWTAESLGYTLEDVKAVRADIEKFFGTVKYAKQIIDKRDFLTARKLESLCVMHHNTKL